jgi:hypothetical protein
VPRCGNQPSSSPVAPQSELMACLLETRLSSAGVMRRAIASQLRCLSAKSVAFAITHAIMAIPDKCQALTPTMILTCPKDGNSSAYQNATTQKSPSAFQATPSGLPTSIQKSALTIPRTENRRYALKRKRTKTTISKRWPMWTIVQRFLVLHCLQSDRDKPGPSTPEYLGSAS